MESPIFLTEEIILGLHRNSLQRFGGSSGIRDGTLIQSALGSAMNTYHYGQGDLSAIAATYAFHLAQAQAFLDGNKRTAVAAALVFLALNGETRTPDDAHLYEAMIAIAEKRMDKTGLAELFRSATQAE